MNKQLGRYRFLAVFFIASLATVWGECGYPRLSYVCGQWIVCAYDMAAHEIVFKMVGL